VLPVLDYVVNYDYITKVLCVNKAKPTTHCNGKCHLMKELAKAAEEQKQQSDKKSVQQHAEVLFCQAFTQLSVPNPFIAESKPEQTGYFNLYFHLGNTSVFRPPIFIS